MHSPAVSRNESLMGILSPDTTINCLWAEGRRSRSGACDTFARHCPCVFVRPKDTVAHGFVVVVFFFFPICILEIWSGEQSSKVHFTCLHHLSAHMGNVFWFHVAN